MKSITEGGLLAQHGATLIDNGYQIVPIRVGKKSPDFDDWQKSRSSKPQLTDWLAHGFKHAGVGILTKHTPAIDLDILDEDVALEMQEWVEINMAPAPMRIGKFPKRLLVFRTNEPFRKRRSAIYLDQFGDKNLIEVLGEGQQFVAYHKHPDTHKPYLWPDESMSPLTVPVNKLPVIDIDAIDAMFAQFEKYAKREKWTQKASKREQHKKIDTDNPWIEDSAPIDMSTEELSGKLMLVPGNDDHDLWVDIGMALHHQYDGDEEGFKLWDEWSESASNYDPEDLRRRWKSFDIGGKKKAPTTARYILKLAKDALAESTAKLHQGLREAMMSATNQTEWDKAKQAIREAEIDQLTRSSLVTLAKDQFEKITGTKVGVVQIRKALAYAPKRANDKIPKWCEPWVYDTSDDRFVNVNTKISVSTQGFNAMYDRQAMTKADILEGRTSPSSSASVVALVKYEIPTVNGRRYEPGLENIYTTVEGTFVNSYPEHEVPAEEDAVTPRDKRNLKRVQAHVEHMLASERERAMLVDWLSWIVQNPGKHANYAILMQGVEGDGKSFFGEMMRAVMGVSNVRMINGSTLESSFSDWAVGQCLSCVEEVRLIRHDKYEVINKIKPFITNINIEVHPKGKAAYNAKNTSSYLLFSNYKDALPIDDNSRRYLVLFSRWQRKEQIREFKTQNPTYYEKLYAAIEESPEVIRKWLLDHQQSDEFYPFGDAPATEAMQVMVRASNPEFMNELNDLIEQRVAPEIGFELLDISRLSDYMVANGIDFPAPKTMAAMLQRQGWEPLGRICIDGEYRRFWSRRIEDLQRRDGDRTVVDDKLVRQKLKLLKAQHDAEDEI